jgi:hypothetical protein
MPSRKEHPVTNPQRVRMYALAHRVGLSNESMHEEIAARYKHASVKSMTDRQYEQYTADLQRRADALPPTAPAPSRAREQASAVAVPPLPAGEGRGEGPAVAVPSPKRTRPPKPAPVISDADAADIAPLIKNLYAGSRGALNVALQRVGGLPWPEAIDTDFGLAVDLLDAFRLCRPTWRRLALHQIEAMIRVWRDYDLPTWREAADRYLTRSTGVGERYFAGILKYTAIELAAASRAKAAIS